MFENTNLSLPTITLLSPEDVRRLQSFSNTTQNANFTEVTLQVGWDSRPVSQ